MGNDIVTMLIGEDHEYWKYCCPGHWNHGRGSVL